MIETSSCDPEAVITAEIAGLVHAVLADEGVAEPYDVGIRLVSDAEMRELNREHRAKDAVTDVLSFPIDGRDDLAPGMERQLGDVVISLAQAERQAPEGTADELRTLIVHGLLHLLEYDHEDDEGEMFARQDALCETMPSLTRPS